MLPGVVISCLANNQDSEKLFNNEDDRHKADNDLVVRQAGPVGKKHTTMIAR